MDTINFLSEVLGEGNYYCLLAKHPDSGHRTQKFYRDLNQLAAVALHMDEEGYDAYFCVSALETPQSRKGTNVQNLSILFLDIDCGEEKDYPDQASGLAALREFCKNSGMPKPSLIVNSGGGLHVYWRLDKEHPQSKWRAAAMQLKNACTTYGLLCDGGCTADSVRLLRVPGTHNYKFDPPAGVSIVSNTEEVHSLDRMTRILPAPGTGNASALPAQSTELQQLFEKHAQAEGTKSLSDPYEKSFRKILQRSIDGRGCAQILETVKHQADVDYYRWTDVLSIAKHCIDGDTAIHKVSSKHPDYSEAETIQIADSLEYPHLCSTFDENNPGGCAGCPHAGKIKSPISLGIEVQEASSDVIEDVDHSLPNAEVREYKVPKYPTPYFRGAKGGIFKRTLDSEGDPIETMVYRDDLYITRYLVDPELGDTFVFRLHTPKNGVREFTVPCESLTSTEEFRKHMSRQGIALIRMNELMAYVLRWIEELQETTEATEAKRQFGWSSDDAKSFVAGPFEIFADRVEANPPSSVTNQYFSAFGVKGTLEKWCELMEFYNRPDFEPHQFMVGLSFGAPLMRFMSVNGAVFHLFSGESGFGKTTGMVAGATVWGYYKDLVIDAQDTKNSQMHRAEIYKNLPVYVDEMTNTDAKLLSEFAYQITGGKQRGRMAGSSNAERYRGESWSTLFGTTANVSLIERIGLHRALPQAEAQRIFEWRVTERLNLTKAETDEFNQGLQKNYGHAGIVYIQYLMKHMDKCEDLLFKVQRKIDDAAGLSAPNRFWSAMFACGYTGLLIAQKAGLINFDMQALFKWIIYALKQRKVEVSGYHSSAMEILSQYYAENFHSVLRIKSTDDGRREGYEPEKIVIPDASPRGQWVMRHEYDTERLYLMPKPLKQWCLRQQVNYGWLMEEMTKPPLHMDKVKMRMGRGTNISMPAMHVIQVQWSSEMEEKVMNQAEKLAAEGGSDEEVPL